MIRFFFSLLATFASSRVYTPDVQHMCLNVLATFRCSIAWTLYNRTAYRLNMVCAVTFGRR